jgi:16S rRNA processing protein RimM
MDEWLMVGKVVAAQGLRGELRVVPRSDFPERFTAPGPRWLRLKQMEPRPVNLEAGRQLPGKELFVVRLAGIDSREAAEALVGQELLVRGDDRPELAEGEFHLSDLVGLQVRMEADGRSIGTVVDLLSAGNDLLEVELKAEGPGEGQGRRVLVPFVEAIVPTVNLSEGWLGLTPPPGLLDP